MTDEYPILDIKSDDEFPEGLGTKEKFWIFYEGAPHLIKFGRVGTGEDWAEKVASELCVIIGLKHAHYDLAVFNGRAGVLTKSVVEEGGRLILGNELSGRIIKGDDKAEYIQKEHTISRVFAALAVYVKKDIIGTWTDFLGYLMLDAWIGNTDRHHENWGIIRAPDESIRLAPTFDHASSLGRELTDDIRRRRLDTKDLRYSVEAFAGRARSALFAAPTDTKPLSPIDAFAYASRLYPPARKLWLSKLNDIDESMVESVFRRVPETVMSPTQKEFASKLLQINRQRLLAILDTPRD